MELCVGWLSLCQLNCSYTQAPYIRFVVITTLLDYLGRHPVWRADKSVLLGGQCSRKLPRHAKVGKLDITSSGKQYVGSCVRFDISVR